MAECPLPKPNTRVRFPSSAPKKQGRSLTCLAFFVDVCGIEPRKWLRHLPGRAPTQHLRSPPYCARTGSDSRHLLQKKQGRSLTCLAFFVDLCGIEPRKWPAIYQGVRQRSTCVTAILRTHRFRFPSSAPKMNAEWKHSAFVFYPSHGLGISLTHAVRRISSRAARRPCISSRAGVHLPCGLMG